MRLDHPELHTLTHGLRERELRERMEQRRRTTDPGDVARPQRHEPTRGFREEVDGRTAAIALGRRPSKEGR